MRARARVHLHAMQETDFRVAARDGTPLFVRCFLPEPGAMHGAPTAIVLVAHGMAEHSARYARLAEALTAHKYVVYANDHRGHGHTAQNAHELGYFAGKDGWSKVVSDLREVLDAVKARHPGLPVFLLGHSMGSYIARALAFRRGDALAGLLLSGTTHDHPIAYRAPRVIVAAERARLGRRGKSALVKKLTFDAFNKKFKPVRTPCDWLSRDSAEVDKYVNDPLCGFECTTQLWYDVLSGLAEICTPKNVARMPKTLPIYVIAGERDPVNNDLSGIRKLRAALDQAGQESITERVYSGARHELFNETNREEVTHELIAWLDSQLT